MRRAFVSHSSADDSFVAEMESLLRAAGFDEVFNDVSAIRPDEKFWTEIEKGIANCDSFVVVITTASNSSEWVKREIEHARGLSKKIIPVWIEDCPIPPAFDDRDVIDLRPRTRKERRFDISRIVKYAPAELIGREDETKLLKDAWERVLRLEGRPHVLTFVALGGEGKTSLVAKWAIDEMLAKGWPGCDGVFAWSFYSQGTREQQAASSDLFLKEALTFFGDDADKAFAASPAGAFEKGQRLARIVGQRRNLLILDGLEPLQYAPTSPTPGELKDQGIAKLLKDLATNSHGLCLVTTRYSLPDLRSFWQTTALEVKLLRLSRAAGVHLLKTLGVRGTAQEFATLVEDVKGHALTLQIMGGFLKRAFGGDIRQRDRVKFEKADEKIDGGHAFRAMAAYAKWMEDGSDEARRELSMLRCLGLFDRPATRDCLEALLQSPAIPGLTEPLVDVAQDDWQFSLDALDRTNLLAVNRDPSGALLSLDTHPHIREYFAKRLREKNPDAWRAAHRRLYEHLCATTPDKPQPTLEDLQPLYQAVVHGCHASMHGSAFELVYFPRILRESSFYSTDVLGAVSSDLGILSCFFESLWSVPVSALSTFAQGWVLNEAGFNLLALLRSREAALPMERSLAMAIATKSYFDAFRRAGNLFLIRLTNGNIAGAVEAAFAAREFARQAESASFADASRIAKGVALAFSGNFHDGFREVDESLSPDPFLDFTFLYGIALLLPAERLAWRQSLSKNTGQRFRLGVAERADVVLQCEKTILRAKAGLEVARKHRVLLSSAMEHLTMGRAIFFRSFCIEPGIGQSDAMKEASACLTAAVCRLRMANRSHFMPEGLLTRAWMRSIENNQAGPDSAQADLDEAWEIAERGPMKLHMADIHLYRARLFFREAQYPWESPQADLAAAEKLINECGYHRRDEELADAKAAILSK